MSEIEVTEAEIKALLGDAWTPKVQMVATATDTYSKQDGAWFKYPGGGGPPASYHRELENPQAEREFWEHGRAAFEGGEE